MSYDIIYYIVLGKRKQYVKCTKSYIFFLQGTIMENSQRHATQRAVFKRTSIEKEDFHLLFTYLPHLLMT